MADSKITDFTDGSPLQATDEFVIARSGANNKIPGSQILNGLITKIFDSTLGTDAASLDTGAGGIGGGFSAVEFLAVLRTDEAAAISNAALRFNNDSGANYDREGLTENNATLTGSHVNAGTGVNVVVHGSGGSANFASVVRGIIPAYAGTTFYKVGEYTAGAMDATAGNCFYIPVAFTWRNTAAITRLAISAAGGQNLKTGSRLIVYGLP